MREMIGFLVKNALVVSLLICAGCTTVADNTYKEQLGANNAQEADINTNSLKSEGEHSTLSVTFEYYEDISQDKLRNISIRYPQISGLKNIDFLKKLNEKLRPPYFEGDKDDRLTIEVWSEYDLIGDKILSFCFHRSINRFDAVHPYSYMWAVTVNAETEEYLALSDIVRVDEDFRELFLSGNFVSDRFSHDELAEFESLDSLYDKIYDFYLTKSTLGVVASTNHVTGDYLAFEVRYTEIKDLLHTNFKFLIDL